MMRFQQCPDLALVCKFMDVNILRSIAIAKIKANELLQSALRFAKEGELLKAYKGAIPRSASRLVGDIESYFTVLIV